MANTTEKDWNKNTVFQRYQVPVYLHILYHQVFSIFNLRVYVSLECYWYVQLKAWINHFVRKMSIDHQDPIGSDFNFLAPTIVSSLSALSSAAILFLILRSETHLSSIYHRIMFGMSLADILSSIAFALTTLPMPEAQGGEIAHWPRIGNEFTCSLQGAIWCFGTFTTFPYNGCLCVYYACVIAIQMKGK